MDPHWKLSILKSAIVLAIATMVWYVVPRPTLAQSGERSGEAMTSEVALLMPIMNSERGRLLFASKGCVVCHSVNGVGGTDAPALDASTMAGPMNPFEFVARMWRGAPAMIAMQFAELGHQIQFTGQELADIIAFAHDPSEQEEFSADDIPDDIARLMEDGQ